MRLGTTEICDPSRAGSDACYDYYGRDRRVEEEDDSRGKKGDGSTKMAATRKKQRWDKLQQPLERMTEGCALQCEAEIAERDHYVKLKKAARWQRRAKEEGMAARGKEDTSDVKRLRATTIAVGDSGDRATTLKEDEGNAGGLDR
ncbi:hypothetical protein BHM03_00045005 [Ensete ventricosum]|nr:hypothetical protein BHM03_00045005 [Ensete ventricosum]